eukprot:scaffold288633_cov45-Prasinocladus_malaysianus.AAC.1
MVMNDPNLVNVLGDVPSAIPSSRENHHIAWAKLVLCAVRVRDRALAGQDIECLCGWSRCGGVPAALAACPRAD